MRWSYISHPFLFGLEFSLSNAQVYCPISWPNMFNNSNLVQNFFHSTPYIVGWPIKGMSFCSWHIFKDLDHFCQSQTFQLVPHTLVEELFDKEFKRLFLGLNEKADFINICQWSSIVSVWCQKSSYPFISHFVSLGCYFFRGSY